MRKFIAVVLELIPVRKVIVFVLRKLTGYAEDLVDDVINAAFEKVMEAERKFLGAKRGEEKARYVRSFLKSRYPEMKDYAINLITEIAVAFLKAQGKIR